MRSLKRIVHKIPVVGPALAWAYVWIAKRRFNDSANYWENRYRWAGTSGIGSYRELAEFKADVLNELVEQHAIDSVIEFGCGDGNQLKLASYPKYLGLDVSAKAVELCRRMFRDDPSKSFRLNEDYENETADLALSLDVIFHLVEDDVFDRYMRMLFAAGQRLVVVYATDTDVQDSPQLPHVRHRRFTRWVEAHEPEWRLARTIENRIPFDAATGTGSAANFYVYERRSTRSSTATFV